MLDSGMAGTKGARIAVWAVVIVVLLGLGTWLALRAIGPLLQPEWQAPEHAPAVISTRGHFHDGELTGTHSVYDYSVRGALPGLAAGTQPPADLIIAIHGFNNSELKALAKFDTAQEGLRNAGYDGAFAGYSWDADTQHDPLSATGYPEGRRHAVGNGLKLARFIQDYRASCPGTRVHLIGYSMGARVALEALLAADTDEALAGEPHVDSVHLVGAAVDNEEVELGERYGAAIEGRCQLLVNYYSPADSKLGRFFPLMEGDRALGQADIEHADRAPGNCRSVDVRAELISYDQRGEPVPDKLGENHSSYLGNRSPGGELLDDGVMDLVAAAVAECAGRSDSSVELDRMARLLRAPAYDGLCELAGRQSLRGDTAVVERELL